MIHDLMRREDGVLRCCICFEWIERGEHYKDAAGDLWDLHKGDCATEAGKDRRPEEPTDA